MFRVSYSSFVSTIHSVTFITTFRYSHHLCLLDCRSTSMGFTLVSVFGRDLVISQLVGLMTCYVPIRISSLGKSLTISMKQRADRLLLRIYFAPYGRTESCDCGQGNRKRTVCRNLPRMGRQQQPLVGRGRD